MSISEDKSVLKDFKNLLEHVAEHITKDEFRKIKRLCRVEIGDGDLNDMVDVGDLFIALQNRTLISPSNTKYLADCLTRIGKKKLADEVNDFADSCNKIATTSAGLGNTRKRSADHSLSKKGKITSAEGEPGPSHKRQETHGSDEIDNGSSPARNTRARTNASPVIGIVTALNAEHFAMSLMFDDKPKPDNQHSTKYDLGKIGGKQAVITQLPVGKKGKNAATYTTKGLCDTFPSLKIVYMVGIAGGVPNAKYDEDDDTGDFIRPHVRKGDVIVSYPNPPDSPAMIDYDYGKVTSNIAADNYIKNAAAARCSTFFLSEDALEAARVLQRAQEYDEKRPWVDVISDSMKNIQGVNARKLAKFERPINADIGEHPEERSRHPDEPMVHFGILASGNSVMRDADVRDQLANEDNIIGFEMENGGVATAAGLSSKGCMFVRGVCDYSDKNKDKKWQKYSALAAAAVAKCIIAPELWQM